MPVINMIKRCSCSEWFLCETHCWPTRSEIDRFVELQLWINLTSFFSNETQFVIPQRNQKLIPPYVIPKKQEVSRNYFNCTRTMDERMSAQTPDWFSIIQAIGPWYSNDSLSNPTTISVNIFYFFPLLLLPGKSYPSLSYQMTFKNF